MTIDGVFTLIASIIALITSIVTLIVSIWHQNYYDKKHKRVVPAVSFWDKNDNIHIRSGVKNARIFTEINNGLEILREANFCIFIKNNEKCKIHNCKIQIVIDNELVINHTIGTIVENRPIVIPTILKNDDFYKMACAIDYYTEAEEHFLYKINSGGKFMERKDEVYLLRKYLGAKHLNILNNQLSLSFSLEEISGASQK